jgi:hypothetical protein
MNNAQEHSVNSLCRNILLSQGLETRVFFHIEDYLVGYKTKCYSLMMNQTRPFEIPNVAFSSSSFLKDIHC